MDAPERKQWEGFETYVRSALENWRKNITEETTQSFQDLLYKECETVAYDLDVRIDKDGKSGLLDKDFSGTYSFNHAEVGKAMARYVQTTGKPPVGVQSKKIERLNFIFSEIAEEKKKLQEAANTQENNQGDNPGNNNGKPKKRTTKQKDNKSEDGSNSGGGNNSGKRGKSKTSDEDKQRAKAVRMLNEMKRHYQEGSAALDELAQNIAEIERQLGEQGVEGDVTLDNSDNNSGDSGSGGGNNNKKKDNSERRNLRAAYKQLLIGCKDDGERAQLRQDMEELLDQSESGYKLFLKVEAEVLKERSKTNNGKGKKGKNANKSKDNKDNSQAGIENDGSEGGDDVSDASEQNQVKSSQGTGQDTEKKLGELADFLAIEHAHAHFYLENKIKNGLVRDSKEGKEIEQYKARLTEYQDMANNPQKYVGERNKEELLKQYINNIEVFRNSDAAVMAKKHPKLGKSQQDKYSNFVDRETKDGKTVLQKVIEKQNLDPKILDKYNNGDHKEAEAVLEAVRGNVAAECQALCTDCRERNRTYLEYFGQKITSIFSSVGERLYNNGVKQTMEVFSAMGGVQNGMVANAGGTSLRAQEMTPEQLEELRNKQARKEGKLFDDTEFKGSKLTEEERLEAAARAARDRELGF